MPRVHHGKVRKSYPVFGLKKGDEAYWWTLKTGPRSSRKCYSKTHPRPSQLTTSEFLGAFYSLEEEIGDLKAEDGLGDSVSDIATRFRELGEEQTAKKDNMPDSLQSGATGELLEERANKCEEIADELDGLTFDVSEKDEGKSDEDYWAEKLEEVQGVDTSAP